MARQTIDISTSTLIRFVLIILAVGLLYFLKSFVLMVFAALILAVAFDRPIDALEKRGVPRILGVSFVYLALFAIIAFLFYLVFPVLALQIKNLINNYSFYLWRVGQLQPKSGVIDIQGVVVQFAESLTASADAFFGTIVAFFGGIISFLTILVVAIFLNIQENGVKKFVFYLAPKKSREYVLSLFEKIQKKVGNWFWGKVALAFITGVLVFIGLYFLHIKYALLLGFLAALLNFIPVIGAVISAVPAVLIALASSPLLALGVILLYVFINAILENFVLMPLLMKKAVDLNPALIILVLILGSELAGVLGVILAIPAAAIVSVLIEEYIGHKSKESAVNQ